MLIFSSNEREILIFPFRIGIYSIPLYSQTLLNYNLHLYSQTLLHYNLHLYSQKYYIHCAVLM